jgi:hypothetical protein
MQQVPQKCWCISTDCAASRPRRRKFRMLWTPNITACTPSYLSVIYYIASHPHYQTTRRHTAQRQPSAQSLLLEYQISLCKLQRHTDTHIQPHSSQSSCHISAACGSSSNQVPPPHFPHLFLLPFLNCSYYLAFGHRHIHLLYQLNVLYQTHMNIKDTALTCFSEDIPYSGSSVCQH